MPRMHRGEMVEDIEDSPAADYDFHAGEMDAIFDLYNACNGSMLDGQLDTQKLAELNNEEQAVLDVSRLRLLAVHVRSGCSRCRELIETLNHVRKELKGRSVASQ